MKIYYDKFEYVQKYVILTGGASKLKLTIINVLHEIGIVINSWSVPCGQ